MWRYVYRRSSRFIIDAFSGYKSKAVVAVPRNTTPPSLRSSSSSNYLSEFSQRVVLQNSMVKKKQKIPSHIDGAKRFYYVDRNKVHHFKPRGCKHWIQNRRNLFKIGVLGLLGCGVVIPAYFWNLESMPYTRRSRLMLLSTSVEKKLCESWLEDIKKYYDGKIVPSHHPESIRVEKIMHNIVEAARKGWREKEERSSIKNWFNRKTSANLEGFKWEIILVNEPNVNAFCALGGKIFVFTGLLNLFKKDAEIAAIIGHEVGHGVARHVAEMICKEPWLAFLVLMNELITKEQWLQTILVLIYDQIYQYFLPDNRLIDILSSLFLSLPLSRRMEMEADYIGLVLMASAGYDPRVAPKVYEKLGEIEGSTSPTRDHYFHVFEDNVSTHPSGKKRSNLLSQPTLMEEALNKFREARPSSQLSNKKQPSILSSFLSSWINEFYTSSP